MEMTPFKIKISIDHYENMGYVLKTGDTLYSKLKNGDYIVYGELIKFESISQCWMAKGGIFKSFPITKINQYIDIVVVPFEQYMKKIREKK